MRPGMKCTRGKGWRTNKLKYGSVWGGGVKQINRGQRAATGPAVGNDPLGFPAGDDAIELEGSGMTPSLVEVGVDGIPSHARSFEVEHTAVTVIQCGREVRRQLSLNHDAHALRVQRSAVVAERARVYIGQDVTRDGGYVADAQQRRILDPIAIIGKLQIVFAEALRDGNFMVVRILEQRSTIHQGHARAALAEICGSGIEAFDRPRARFAGRVPILDYGVVTEMPVHRAIGTKRVRATHELNGLQLSAILQFQRVTN